MRISTHRSAVVTFVVMILIIALVASYFVFRNKSALQKRNNTSAAQALIIDEKDKSFTDLEGNPVVTNNDFGTIIVVMSWASWCPQCGNDLIELGKITQEYKDKKVSIMAVNRGEDRYSAQRFLDTVHPPSELRIVLDASDYYFSHSDGYAMPETIIFNKDGSIALHQRGDINVAEIKQVLDDLLK